jgi:hypothetical protein
MALNPTNGFMLIQRSLAVVCVYFNVLLKGYAEIHYCTPANPFEYLSLLGGLVGLWFSVVFDIPIYGL